MDASRCHSSEYSTFSTFGSIFKMTPHHEPLSIITTRGLYPILLESQLWVILMTFSLYAQNDLHNDSLPFLTSHDQPSQLLLKLASLTVYIMTWAMSCQVTKRLVVQFYFKTNLPITNTKIKIIFYKMTKVSAYFHLFKHQKCHVTITSATLIRLIHIGVY